MKKTSDEHRLSVRPDLYHAALEIEDRSANEGIPIAWVQSVRTDAEQAELWAQGRTKPGKRVTNARTARETAHGCGCALDFAVLDESGRPTWAPEVEHLYDRVAELVDEVGADGYECESGRSFGDRPHVQIIGWKRYRDDNWVEASA